MPQVTPSDDNLAKRSKQKKRGTACAVSRLLFSIDNGKTPKKTPISIGNHFGLLGQLVV
jgi:hypothetical protein